MTSSKLEHELKHTFIITRLKTANFLTHQVMSVVGDTYPFEITTPCMS